MSENLNSTLQYFVLIAEQKKKDKFLSLLAEYDAKVIETVYGHGSMSPSVIATAFGFEVEQHKAIISCLIKTEKAKELIDLLYNEYNFSKPNTGIAFTIPVEGLAF